VRTYAIRRNHEPRLSAQISLAAPANPQATALRPSRSRSSDKSQELAAGTRSRRWRQMSLRDQTLTHAHERTPADHPDVRTRRQRSQSCLNESPFGVVPVPFK
jgi:hypothetical protein